MTPPALLTAPTRLPDTAAATECVQAAKRNLPPFGAILAHPPPPPRSFTGPSALFSTTSTSTSLVLECDAYDDDGDAPPRGTSTARQWAGAPIRAIAPLPRRKLAHGATRLVSAATAAGVMCHVHHATTQPQPQPQPFVARVPHFWDDTDEDEDEEDDNTDADADSRADIGGEEDEGVEVEGHSEDAPSRTRYCTYESITAAGGLSSWSFEELRVECYAQSLIARGSKPPPVVQPSLAIPPAFVPRFVPRS